MICRGVRTVLLVVLLFAATEPVPADPVNIQINQDKSFTLVLGNGSVFPRVSSGFRSSGKIILGTSYAEVEAKVLEPGKRLAIVHRSATLPTLIVTFDDRDGMTRVSSEVFPDPTFSEIEALLPLVFLPGGQKETPFQNYRKVYVNGYQSWAFTGWVRLDRKKSRFDDPLAYLAWGNNNRHLYLDSHLSWWFTSFRDDDEEGFFVGAITAQKHKTAFVNLFDGGEFRGFYVINGPGLSIPPGTNSIVSEQIVLVVGKKNPERDYAELVRKQAGVEVGDLDLSGWNSWSSVFQNVNERDVLKNARFIKDHLTNLDLKAIYLDDGWEKSWGDWTANKKFPGGLARTAKAIVDLGFTPGIWIAPFVVDRKSSIFREHRDWLLKSRSDGSAVDYNQIPQVTFLPKTKFLLDLTNATVRTWLVTVFRGLYSDGFRIFKIDFLLGGAYEGAHRVAMTALEAYRLGLRTIRNALPKDALIIACGALPLPSVGFCDAFRIGPDILYQFGSVTWPFVATTAKNTANLYHYHRTIFQNDPDTVIVRRPLSDKQAEATLAFMALSGGVFILGDYLTKLGGNRVALLKKPWVQYIRNFPGRMVPLDYSESIGKKVYNPVFDAIIDLKTYSGTNPEFWFRGDEQKALLGVFNWGNQTRERIVDLSGVARFGDRTKVKTIVGAPPKIIAGKIVFKQSPSSAHIFELVGGDGG